MKRFDPSVGWIDPSDDDPAARVPSSVYHFNRQGQRLNVAHVEDGPTASGSTAPASEEPASPAVERMREAARAPQRPLRAPAETAGMVRELFERLDEADPTQALMARVADNLKTLDDLEVRKGQLERVLADIAQEMSHLQVQVHADLDAARDSEDRNLKLRQYRRELLDQLAQRLPAAGTP